MTFLTASIEIAAPADRVWAVLTDFATYPDWNPMVRRMSGEARTGARLSCFIQPPGQKGMAFRPRVTACEAPRVFEWLGDIGVPALFDGRHRYEIRPRVGGGVTLTQSERFTGLLVGAIFNAKMRAQTLAGFEALNAALKARAEA